MSKEVRFSIIALIVTLAICWGATYLYASNIHTFLRWVGWE